MNERYMRDNADDRALGKKWEEHFGRMAAWYGKAWYAYQHDRVGASRWQSKGARPSLTPDIQIFSDGGASYELKHKNATKGFFRRYGLETYRLESLVQFQRETQRPVLYAIHDWELAGFKTSDDKYMGNVLQDWRVCDVETLRAYIDEASLRERPILTWLNGKPKEVPGYFWPTSLWQPGRLDLYWGLPS